MYKSPGRVICRLGQLLQVELLQPLAQRPESREISRRNIRSAAAEMIGAWSTSNRRIMFRAPPAAVNDNGLTGGGAE